MNSQEEKELFEQYGWEYNLVEREWVSPDGHKITTDALMEYTTDPEGEYQLRMFIVQHGRKP